MKQLILACLVLGPLAGCSSTAEALPPGAPASTPVDGEPEQLLFPTLRVVVAADRDSRERRRSKLPVQRGVNAWKFVAAFEGDLSGTTGDFNQDIEGGNSLRYEGFEAVGATSIKADFSLIEGSAAFRLGGRKGGFEGGGLLGIGVSVLDIDLSEAGGPRSSSSYDYIGGLIGFYAGYEPLEWLDIYTRGSGLFGDEAMSMRIEAGVGFRVARPIRLFTGVRWMHYERDGAFTDRTNDLTIAGAGLVLGLEFDF